MKLPIFFISSIVFMAYLAIRRGKQTRNQENLNEAFLERERRANATRRQDISTLEYLPFSIDALPIAKDPDPQLAAYEATLQGLLGKRIINLSHYSNTDLKLLYGPANFMDLSEYDDNYHMLSSTLLDYAKRESELGCTEASIAILEYAMSLKIDNSQIYLLLAKLYQDQHMPEKIQDIAAAVSAMDQEFSSFVLPKLPSDAL